MREVKAGRGYVDVLVNGVPLELKLASESRVENFVRTSLPQATQYAVSRGRRVGLLAVLDLTERTSSAPRLTADVEVFEGKTTEGIKETGPVAIVAIAVRGALIPPSGLLPTGTAARG